MSRYPQRIVCLTEETTETLYLLGQQDRIVGVSGYTVRPPEARQKPRVSAFINARFDKIEALEPDLVLAFSDLQADLGAELVRRGIPVVTFNQRTVAEILQMIRMLGGLVGCQGDAEALAARLEADLDRIRDAASRFPSRLRTFFEEWDPPLISGIRWVEELVEAAGGAPIFPELAGARLAKDRIVDPGVRILKSSLGHYILLDDRKDTARVEVRDSLGNRIILDKDGVTIIAGNQTTINEGNQVTEVDGNATLRVSGDHKDEIHGGSALGQAVGGTF